MLLAPVLVMGCRVVGSIVGAGPPEEAEQVFSIRTVVLEGAFAIGTLESSRDVVCDYERHFTFETAALGNIEAVVDWENPENRLDVVIREDRCNCELTRRNACGDPIASSIGESANKPNTILAEEEPAGTYTLSISNLQEGETTVPDSGTYQVISYTE